MISQRLLAALFTAVFLCVSAVAQTTAFSYQGSLRDGPNPANGNYDFEFRLFDALAGGAQQGAALQSLNVAVANGVFTVSLDFGAAVLPGADRFLDIAVRTAGGGTFSPLAPRTKINSEPYSIKSLNAASANSLSASCVGCVTAAQIGSVSGSTVTGTIPIASVPAGSGNYIQNTTSPQSSSDFSISGTGTANIFRAATQYNVGATRVLSVAGTNNIFAGVGAGQANSTGVDNAFFGSRAGGSNTTGIRHAFFGSGAGLANTIGAANAFFGLDAGRENTTGNSNAFFGAFAGTFNTASDNSFFGSQAGFGNGAGNRNAFFGSRAGFANSIGVDNAFFGADAGDSNTTGVDNSFFGSEAGGANTTGIRNAFLGSNAGQSNTTGGANAFFGINAGDANTEGNTNAFFGGFAGRTNITGSNNTIVGASADVNVNNLTFATAIGAGAAVSTSNTVVLGRAADTVRIPGAINAAGLVKREYTASTPSAAIPVAYGSISAAGTILSGTGNFTVAHTVTGEYDITITGETYSNAEFTVTIMPVTNSPRISGVADPGTAVRVNMWNLAGTFVDNAFQFTIWKTNPN